VINFSKNEQIAVLNFYKLFRHQNYASFNLNIVKTYMEAQFFYKLIILQYFYRHSTEQITLLSYDSKLKKGILVNRQET
jgi:hypothetical protein